jgi:citrate lyase subunit beta / citryl-CoA lyase
MYRSLLFVPANDARRLERAHERGADAVILDLEDAVAAQAKRDARAGLRAAAEGLAAKGAQVLVRINTPWREALSDLEAAVCPAVRGVVAPKIDDAARARVVGEMIREVEKGRAMPAATQLIALIESAAGLRTAAAIAAVEGVSGLALGSEDLCLEMGVAPGADVLDLPCKLIALAAAPRRQMALGLPVSIAEFRDLEAYGRAVSQARRIGMTGALCIHPAQVAALNSGFAPSAAEIEEAKAITAAWEAAVAEGRAVASHAGRMIDAPVAERARRVLHAANAGKGEA